MKLTHSQNNNSVDFSLFSKAKELKSKIIFTLLALIIFRLGSYIPLPSINNIALEAITQKNSNGILGMFNMLSGGSLGRMSIFALAIMPYITASIIVQLLSVLSKTLDNLKKEGETGRKKINQYTRLATVALACLQAYGIAVGLEAMNDNGMPVVSNPGLFFKLTTIFTLVSGTMFLMWMGEQISQKGIGNGTSLIIFSGIVAGLPRALASTFELSRAGALSPAIVILLFLISLSIVFFIVYMEKAMRKVAVQYPKRQIGNKIVGGETSYIPLKLNTAGVIPPIFASSLLLFPVTLANLSTNKSSIWIEKIAYYLSHGKPLYILFYILLIIFFSFFYTSIIFNPNETAENLRKNGGIIPGRRPGKDTAEYFDYILTRLTVIGALYISFICILPEIIISRYSVPFYLGGTSLLIVVNVVLDTITQIQTQLFAHKYESLIKKVRIRGK
jgi:preprotein translocase subunit SecY